MDPHNTTLLGLFTRYTILSVGAQTAITNAAEYFSCRPNDIIFKEGKRDDHEYFLIEGIAGRGITNDEGDTITTGIYAAPAVVIPHFARTVRNNSIMTLQALTPCVFGRIPVSVFDQLRLSHTDIGLVGQQVVNNELADSIAAETTFRSSTAKQRLQLLRKRLPDIESLIPHHVIASYLGITPVSFSRLRADLG